MNKIVDRLCYIGMAIGVLAMVAGFAGFWRATWGEVDHYWTYVQWIGYGLGELTLFLVLWARADIVGWLKEFIPQRQQVCKLPALWRSEECIIASPEGNRPGVIVRPYEQ